ncbi:MULTISPECIES: cytochrome c family protein [unclassified Bradyrhizobium]|uniref:c-type cytochrome n=1 Tax=unclassified Bradyrhizobium TaxID=2631580 RepID=UPI0020B25D93|nr:MULTISPECIES: c-type cytochrome [unclassified Bradyrhizobium]MCP3402091.1 c-type cytochrome [Bradyrhizobium sp. CCGB20]MCP3410579.1 c-type cytochrome [Bradyrhizobium sp. CCGB01]
MIHPTTRLLIVSLLAVTAGACKPGKAAGADNFMGDARRGTDLVKQYQCGTCHDIPGVAGADGNVGPPLQRIGTRTYIAGYIQNSPDNMAAWIEDPQRALPGNAMPRMGIPQKDARDIAAFLYTLK